MDYQHYNLPERRLESVHDTGREYPDPRYIAVIDDGMEVGNRILVELSKKTREQCWSSWSIEKYASELIPSQLGQRIRFEDLPEPCKETIRSYLKGQENAH